MLKEYLIAIFLGTLLGLGLTGGYFTMKKSNNTLSATPSTPTPEQNLTSETETIEVAAESAPAQDILIETPQDYDIVSNSKIEINGNTIENSMVVITTPVGSYTAQADQTGAFTTKIDLESGFNIVKINSFDETDNQYQRQMVVTYSTAKI